PRDRFGNHRGRLEGIHHIDALREIGPQIGNGLLDRPGGIQRVGTRGQLDRHTGGWLAVVKRAEGRVLCTQLDPGDVTQAHLGTVTVHLHQYVAKLLRRIETGLADDGRVEQQARHRQRTADTPAAHQGVLTSNDVWYI